MTPSCFRLDTVAGNRASLYVREISTLECLALFDDSAQVALEEFGAQRSDTGRRGWIGTDKMPRTASVSAWREVLADGELDVIDFSAVVADTSISTHDDGEAHFVFPSDTAALSVIRTLLDRDAEEFIWLLLSNRGRYVARRNDILQVFETFEADLAEA